MDLGSVGLGAVVALVSGSSFENLTCWSVLREMGCCASLVEAGHTGVTLLFLCCHTAVSRGLVPGVWEGVQNDGILSFDWIILASWSVAEVSVDLQSLG